MAGAIPALAGEKFGTDAWLVDSDWSRELQPLDPQDGSSLFTSGDGKSYLIPAAEIITFEFLLNQFNRHFIDEEYESDLSSMGDNLHTGWVIDKDPFDTNQLWHPYGGSIYFGFARSAGLDFWESSAYTFLGSALWEVAGETTPPSLNDQISTGIGGSFLGEALFRMASWLLESVEGEPGFGRELGSALVSPPTWFNRRVVGGRFNAVFPSRQPAVFSRAGIGGSFHTQVSNETLSDDVTRGGAIADFEMEYGLPGKSSYHYQRPFDYFHVEGTVTTSPDATFENVSVRGLVAGQDYGSGDYRGVVGLYGSYDYLSPELFRISTTALSFGTTGQYWLSDSLALQGTFVAGVGYGAAGTVAEAQDERDYHYGVAPQAALSLRLILGDAAMLDVVARDFYVTGGGAESNGESENILRGHVSLYVRIYEQHAIGLQYVLSRRDAPDNGNFGRNQTVGTARVVYTFLLGNTKSHLGAVDWR